MWKLENALALGLLLCFGTVMDAQTNVTTSGGSTNTVPIYTGSSTLGNSPIAISGSNVGIGTANPGSKLDVEGGGIGIEGLPPLTATAAFGGVSTDTHWMDLYPSLGGSDWNSIVQPGDQALIYSGTSIGTGTFVLAPWANGYLGLRNRQLR